MMTLEQINALMGEVGPLDDAVVAVARVAEDSWVIRFEAVDVQAEYDAEGGRLMLSTTLGVSPSRRTLEVYETMLIYTSAWRETDGIRMALDGPGGELLQMADLHAEGLAAGTLVTVAVNLAERAMVWRGFVGRADPEGASAAPVADLQRDHLIRI